MVSPGEGDICTSVTAGIGSRLRSIPWSIARQLTNVPPTQAPMAADTARKVLQNISPLGAEINFASIVYLEII
jgi:hypothetical protein